jgi:hypothetical protein
MKSTSIIVFERFYLLSVTLSFLNDIFYLSERHEYIIGATLGVILDIFFWYQISRRAQKWAKWVITALTAIALFVICCNMLTESYAGHSSVYLALFGLAHLLNILAISFLFRRDAKAWLQSKGGQAQPDVLIFE